MGQRASAERGEETELQDEKGESYKITTEKAGKVTKKELKKERSEKAENERESRQMRRHRASCEMTRES